MSSGIDRAADEMREEPCYTETVIDHARNPRNVGSIPNADGFASVTGPCGDTMEIWLKVNNGVIRKITFWTDGCFSTIAAGSMVTELASGKSVPEALGLRQQTVLDALGGMPEDSAHCALLAANTLNTAIKDYIACKNTPWKRDYRQ